MANRKQELKPCPFCGSAPTVQPWHGGGPRKRLIGCDNDECYAASAVCGNTLGVATRRWNTRSSGAERRLAKALRAYVGNDACLYDSELTDDNDCGDAACLGHEALRALAGVGESSDEH